MSTEVKRPRARRRSTISGTKTGRAMAATLAMVLVATLAGQSTTAPASAAESLPPLPTDVKGVAVKPVSVTPRDEWTAAAREVTEENLPPDTTPAGVQTVELPTAAQSSQSARVTSPERVKAGSLPVYVAPAQGVSAADPAAGARTAGPSPVRKVRVELAGGKAATAAGVNGLILRLSRADGAAAAGQAQVTVDYRSFAGMFGGDWASRLRLVRLADGQPVPTVNDIKAGTITATAALPASGGVSGFAVAAAPDGDNGDYKATSLSAASSWQVSQQTGSFSWSYPIKTPPALGGMAPSLSLAYSSGSIDGLTSGNNTQGSWIGDGWAMWPGFIERSYRSCFDDRDEKEKKDPNNKDVQGGDLCYFSDNATMSFNGSATELVKVASTDGGPADKSIEYRGVSDDGSKIELIRDGRDNGDVDGAHWQVTTIDGTQYHFGRDEGQGGFTAGTKTNSTWAVPVYSNHPDDPGYDKEFAESREKRAWRWNLDYVVDPSGNTVTYFYDKESGAYAREGDEDKRITYDRGGSLTRVEYGSRSNAPASVRPAARILFDVNNRCVGKCINGDEKPIAGRFPDTPWDQYCDKAPCKTQYSPTFWTQKRLSNIRTQVYAGTGDSYNTVDSWALDHTYLMAGGNESKPMWLRSITHTGHVTTAGGPAVTDPAVVFDPTRHFMPNRVDNSGDGHSSLFRNRIASITTESGAQIGVGYSKPECTSGTLPKAYNNTKPCFPQYYGEEGEKPKIDWFHKYRVERVDVYDNTGGFSHQQTSYKYLDEPAWAYDDSELVKPKKRTWGQFRGYGHVQVLVGAESGPQSNTEYRYFRGMDGDKQPKDDKERPPTGTPREVSVKDSFGGKVEDHRAYAGMVRETIAYNGVGGDWISGTLNTPARQGPTATAGPLQAWKTNIETARSRTKLSNGTTRWTKTVTAVNEDNLPTKVDDLGDEATSEDDRCVVTQYARNETTWMLNRVNRVETLGVNCAAQIQRPRDVLRETRTYYDKSADDAFGAAPTRGLAVRVDELDSWNGTTPQFVTTSRTAYDPIGRITSQSDALNRTTTTDYTPSETGPLTRTTVTNPAKHTTTTTLDPALGVAVTTVDANGAVARMTYDGSGRLLAVWAPGRDRAKYPTAPSVSFEYKLRKTEPSYVKTRTLMPSGDGVYRTSVALLDGLLRTRQTQTQTVAGGRAITETVYDSRGLVDWTSNPYVDIDGTAPNTTLVTPNGRPEIPAITQNVYDGAGRLTKSILVVNGDDKWGSTTTYAGEKTSVTPPDGATATTTITNARGHTAEIRHYKDPKNVGSDDPAAFDRTTYGYTKTGQLATVVDPGRNTWSYEYDLRGRKIVERDPDKGTGTSDYDDAGQLSWTKDDRGRVLAYTYDDLGRRTSLRQDSKDGRKRAEWEYDTLKYGKGKLTKSTRYEYDAAGNTHAYTNAITAYDSAGRPTGSTVTIPKTHDGLCATATLEPCSYKVGYTYRPNGALDQFHFPALAGLPAETVTTAYNHVGLPMGLGSFIGEVDSNYVQGVVYNQLDQLIGQNLGDHGTRVGLRYGIDEPTGRLRNFRATPELKTPIYDLSYEYDPAGNVKNISDTAEGQPAETQCFRYDYLRRMTDAWTPASRNCATDPGTSPLGGPAPYARSYTFDAAGNRKTEVVHSSTDTTRTYSYPSPGGLPGSKPHAATQVDSTGAEKKTQQYAYDQVGNMTCRPAAATANTCPADGKPGIESQALTWDDEGHLAKSTDKTGETSFVYDADGNRLIRRDPAGATLYLPHGTELRKPKAGAATGTRYYSHAGSTVAVRTPAGATMLVNDHHGTGAATVSNDKNLTVTRRRTLPYGDVRGTKPATWAGDKGFVGGTQDNTGLTHLGAREYDPTLGRFISVDPIMNLTDPQQWNGYSYANDSPVTMSDPDGLEPRPWHNPAYKPEDCANSTSQECHPAGVGSSGGSGAKSGGGSIGQGTSSGPVKQSGGCSVCKGVGGVFKGIGEQVVDTGKGIWGWGKENGKCWLMLGPGNPMCDLKRIGAALDNPGEAINGMWDAIKDPVISDWNNGNRGEAAGRVAFMIGELVIGSKGAGLAGRAARKCNSFAPGTLVLLADGTTKRAIEDLKVDDVVLATDPETGDTRAEPITKLHLNADTELTDLTLVSSDGTVAVVETTWHHWFWSKSRQDWVDAAVLQIDEVLATVDGREITVKGVRNHTGDRFMHDLTVARLHTYYVMAGNTPVLVHNCGGSGPAAGVLEVSDGVKSIKAFQNYSPSGRGGIEYVFDPDNGRLLVGAPKSYLGISGSPHQQLARAGGLDESRVLGGIFRRDGNGRMGFDENSGHYGDRWTSETRQQFSDFLNRHGIDATYAPWGG